LLVGCAQLPFPDQPSFAVFGDAPYTEAEVQRLDAVIEQMNAQPLAFVVHVGDIGASALACTDGWLLQRKAQFARIRHPFILLPGDNEWSDCKDPLARLQRWREMFCDTPGEFCEQRRWESHGWVFVALNVPGHDNNVRHAEHGPRMERVLKDIDQAAVLAEHKHGLIVLMQANPFFTFPRDGFASLRDRLAALGSRMPGRILLIHGDTHLYRDDEPLPGVRRIEVWGSPVVSWIRVPLTPDTALPPGRQPLH
jgi:hypothetical protein